MSLERIFSKHGFCMIWAVKSGEVRSEEGKATYFLYFLKIPVVFVRHKTIDTYIRFKRLIGFFDVIGARWSIPTAIAKTNMYVHTSATLGRIN